MRTLQATALLSGDATWIDGVDIDTAGLASARPVGTLVYNTVDGEIYRSTNATVPTYVQVTNNAGGGGLGGITVVNASPYVALPTDRILLVDVSPCTITLLAVADALYTLGIKDRTGSASGGTPLTINAAGGETIDGEASDQIVVGYGSVTLVPNGTEWSIF